MLCIPVRVQRDFRLYTLAKQLSPLQFQLLKTTYFLALAQNEASHLYSHCFTICRCFKITVLQVNLFSSAYKCLLIAKDLEMIFPITFCIN